MKYWNKERPSEAPLIYKPLDLSSLPSGLSQGRELFAEPVEDEELGVPPLDVDRSEGIRVPDLQPMDLSASGIGNIAVLNAQVADIESSLITIDEDIDEFADYVHPNHFGDVASVGGG